MDTFLVRERNSIGFLSKNYNVLRLFYNLTSLSVVEAMSKDSIFWGTPIAVPHPGMSAWVSHALAASPEK